MRFDCFLYLRGVADVHDRETRSFNMSRIRSSATKPEMIVRKFLFARGLRYRVNDKTLPGKPDIVMRKKKTVIFINGCFWHGHNGCKYFVIPKTNTEWWLSKISATKIRDVLNEQWLRDAGWKVIKVYECDLKSGNTNFFLDKLFHELH